MNNLHIGMYKGAYKKEGAKACFYGYWDGEHKLYRANLFEDIGKRDKETTIPVDPMSLSLFTDLYDKNNTPIFGSFSLPDGTMTKGGDLVETNCNYINKHPHLKFLFNVSWIAKFASFQCQQVAVWYMDKWSNIPYNDQTREGFLIDVLKVDPDAVVIGNQWETNK